MPLVLSVSDLGFGAVPGIVRFREEEEDLEK